MQRKALEAFVVQNNTVIYFGDTVHSSDTLKYSCPRINPMISINDTH